MMNNYEHWILHLDIVKGIQGIRIDEKVELKLRNQNQNQNHDQKEFFGSLNIFFFSFHGFRESGIGGRRWTKIHDSEKTTRKNETNDNLIMAFNDQRFRITIYQI